MTRGRVVVLVLAGLALLGALPVTFTRLTGWTGDVGIVIGAFAPFALLPYAVALTLLGVALVRGRRSWLEVGGAALSGLLLLLHVVWVAPFFVGGAPDPAEGAERVTVMSANVEYGFGDAAFVVGQVRERGVDVLVVSEITPRFVAAADRAGLRDVLPHRTGLPGATTQGTMVFSTEPIRPRARVDTIFDSLVVTTHDLTLLATHPAPPQLPDDWRHDQPLLLEAAREHDVDAVVGDLNATLDHPTLRELVDAGWRDAVELTNGGFDPTWPAHGEKGFPWPVVQIDHVMARDTVAVVSVDSFEVPDADHYAVVAVLAAT